MHKQLPAIDYYKQKGTRFYLSFSQFDDAFVVVITTRARIAYFGARLHPAQEEKREREKWITAVGINVVSFLFFTAVSVWIVRCIYPYFLMSAIQAKTISAFFFLACIRKHRNRSDLVVPPKKLSFLLGQILLKRYNLL